MITPRFSFVSFDSDLGIDLPVHDKSDLSFSVTSVSKFKAGVVSESGTIAIDPYVYNIGTQWVSLDLDFSDFGFFRIALFDLSNGIIATSNRFYYACNTKGTSVLEYKLNEAGLGWNCPVGWNKIRLPMYLEKPQFTQKQDVFVKLNGQSKVLYAEVGKEYELKTEYLPEDVHQKIVIALSHDNIIVNGISVYKTMDYTINWDSTRDIDESAQATCKLTQNLTYRNSNCGECVEVPFSCTAEWSFADFVCQTSGLPLNLPQIEVIPFGLSATLRITFNTPTASELRINRKIDDTCGGGMYVGIIIPQGSTFYEQVLQSETGCSFQQVTIVGGIDTVPQYDETYDYTGLAPRENTGNALSYILIYKTYINGVLDSMVNYNLLSDYFPTILQNEYASLSELQVRQRANALVNGIGKCPNFELLNDVIKSDVLNCPVPFLRITDGTNEITNLNVLPCQDSTNNIVVETSGDWTVEDEQFVSVNPKNGNGATNVIISTLTNSGLARDVVLYFKSGSLTKGLMIYQPECQTLQIVDNYITWNAVWDEVNNQIDCTASLDYPTQSNGLTVSFDVRLDGSRNVRVELSFGANQSTAATSFENADFITAAAMEVRLLDFNPQYDDSPTNRYYYKVRQGEDIITIR